MQIETYIALFRTKELHLEKFAFISYQEDSGQK